jgi:REP element-mobilizing transposase RayT
MDENPRPGRRSIRLPGYDYSQPGAYFVTVCAHDRRPQFGEIVNGEMAPSEKGVAVQAAWAEIPIHFTNVECDAFCMMPNHIHGILFVLDQDGRGTACRAPTVERFSHPVRGSLATIVRSFKAAATRRINALRGSPLPPVWQRGFYEHIIREEDELERIRRYICENPARWSDDAENPLGSPKQLDHTNARKT